MHEQTRDLLLPMSIITMLLLLCCLASSSHVVWTVEMWVIQPSQKFPSPGDWRCPFWWCRRPEEHLPLLCSRIGWLIWMLLGQPASIMNGLGTAQSYSIKSQAYRVPNLQLDLLTLDVDHSCPKLHPNSQVMHLGQVLRSQPRVQIWNARREALLLIIDQVSLTGWKRLSVNCRSKQDLPTPDWYYT